MFENMTDEQLMNLTDAEVNVIIDRGCAEQGIPLWTEELAEPRVPVPTDMQLYRVAGYFFQSENDAVAVRDLINNLPRWKEVYSWGRSRESMEWTQDDGKADVTIVEAYRPETWHKHRSDLDAYETRKKIYDETRKKNEKAYESRAGVARTVWKQINDARERVSEKARLDKLYARYLTIANGDAEVARKFLIVAEKLDDSWQPKAN